MSFWLSPTGEKRSSDDSRQVVQYSRTTSNWSVWNGDSYFCQTGPLGSAHHGYGDGQQSRCFGYVGDVVGALIRLMEHKQAVGQVFKYRI